MDGPEYSLTSISPAPRGSLEAIIDRGCCIDQRQLKAALEKLTEYWFSKKRYYSDLTSEKIRQITRVLNPVFDHVPTLSSRIDLIGEQMVKLTDDQYEMVETVEDSPRVICTGGAGTGKSLIAVRTAISEAQKATASSSYAGAPYSPDLYAKNSKDMELK